MPSPSTDIDYWRGQLAHRDVEPDLPWPDADVMVVVGRLVAAYDEAVAAERARIRAGVEGLPKDRGDDTWSTVPRAAVLAIVDPS